MEWRSEVDVPFAQFFYLTSAVLFFFSLYNHSFLLVLLIALLVSFNVVTHFYFKYLLKHVRFVNAEQKIRLFVGDEDHFTIDLANDGKMPFFHGLFTFTLDDLVTCKLLSKENFGQKQLSYAIPVGAGTSEVKRTTIQVKGLKRGAAKFRSIHLNIRDWFGLGEMRLTYDPIVRTEIIVYPELKPVLGLNQIQTFWQGTHPYLHSLNEDLTSPSGTRDYVSTDSFRRIHWKASAKSGKLETKVFEKTNGMKWVLLFNLNRDRLKEHELEREISCMAYVCRFATEHNIPFSVFINIKVRGRYQILHLDNEAGREHLGKALELLARISVNSLTVPVNEMLAYVDRQHFQNAVMILFNLRFLDDDFGVFRKWQKLGLELYRVEQSGETSEVIRLTSKKAVS